MNLRTALTVSLLLTAALVAACATPDSGTGPTGDQVALHPLAAELPVAERSFRIGVSGFIPRSYQNPSDADWQDLFDRIPEYGELFGVHSGWNEGELDAEGVPIVVQLAFNVTAGTDTSAYVALGFEPDSLSQQQADTYFQVHGDDFEAVAVEVARQHRPGIMILGVEINRFYEHSPSGFADFIQFYERTYDAIKAVSPDTQVGSNFLLEYMMGEGRRSGLQHQEHWQLLGEFGQRLDLATFTLFPFLDFDAPAEIPADYLRVITEHTDRPIMITETGWPSQPIAGIRGDEDAQLEYLNWLLEATRDLPVDAVIWVFPHDHELGLAGGIFDHVSTRAYDGSPKPVYEYWQALRSLPVGQR